MASYVLEHATAYAARSPEQGFEPNLYVIYECQSMEDRVRLMDTHAETVLEHRRYNNWLDYLDRVKEVYWARKPVFLLEMSGNGAPRVSHNRGHMEVHTGQGGAPGGGREWRNDASTATIPFNRRFLSDALADRPGTAQYIQSLTNRWRRDNAATSPKVALRILGFGHDVENNALAWALLYAGLERPGALQGIDALPTWPQAPQRIVHVDAGAVRSLMVDSDPPVTAQTFRGILSAMGHHLMPVTTPQVAHMFRNNGMHVLKQIMGAALHVVAPGVDNRMVVAIDNRGRFNTWRRNRPRRAPQFGSRMRVGSRVGSDELVVFDKNYQKMYVQYLQQLRRHDSLRLRI